MTRICGRPCIEDLIERKARHRLLHRAIRGPLNISGQTVEILHPFSSEVNYAP